MKLGVIGYGNLGKALVRGLVHTGVTQSDILVNVRSEKTGNAVKEAFPQIAVTESKKELVEKSDAFFLVVEPKNAAEVLQEIGSCDINGKMIISFMAGITRQEIKQMLGDAAECVIIIRVMPNIAIATGTGILGIACDEADNEKVKEVMQILGRLGYAPKMSEVQLDAITVTAASGLAFAVSLMNAYQRAGNELLHSEEQSREITLRVFENVIDLAKKENCSFEEIVSRITTQGGTTETGLNHLKQDAITDTLTECMQKSYEKCRRIQE